MIRILHVVFSLAPGGMENGIVNISSQLDPEKYDIHVCCLDEPGAFASRFPKPEQIYSLGRGSGFSLAIVAKLYRLITEIKPDVVHSHNFGPLIYSALATLFGLRIPILHGEHGQFTTEELSSKRLRQRRWLYRCCREVHTVSHGLRDYIINLKLGSVPITALVNGVDLKRFTREARPELRESLGIPPESPVIGMVARLRPTKRHTLLIQAFSALPAQDPHPHLIIVGDGPTMEEVKKEVGKSPYKDQIHLVGFQKDPVPYYHIIDLLVIPSSQEGLSNAILESLACSVPVICHTACGNDEVITNGQDGWIVPLDTASQIRDQLQSALSQKDRLRQMGESGREKVAHRFPLTKMLEAYEATYKRVARA